MGGRPHSKEDVRLGQQPGRGDGGSLNLSELQRTWDELAKKDAMWAVLSGPLAAERKWDAAAFFQTGTDEVNFILRQVREAGADPGRGRALDFGSGLGRLTQALATHFDRVDGVDIAPEMIRQARLLAKGRSRGIAYHLNESPDLRLFADDTFDFLYSNITLQHIDPALGAGYIEEFFRVLRPGGIAVFQVPSQPVHVEHPRTVMTEPLPPAACRAAIEAPARMRCAPGARFTLVLPVRNQGGATWRALALPDGQYAIRLGNHWRSRFGRMVQFDDVRGCLPHDLAPGELTTVVFESVAPARPATYQLELDMVQETVRWFAEAGSRTRRMKVRVDGALQSGEVQGLPPQMAMNYIPRPDIEALIARCGAELLAVQQDDAPGPGFISYRYIARVA